MNAVSALARDRAEQQFAEALAAANKWLDVARPIILTTIRIDEAVETDLWKLHQMEPDQRYTYDEASGYIQKARENLEDMLHGIRSDFLADNLPDQPRPDAPEAEWEARDEFADALETEAISVRAAIKQIEREDLDAFRSGGR